MDKKKLQFVGVKEPRLLRAHVHPVFEIFKRGTPFQMFWHKDFGEHIPKFLCEPTTAVTILPNNTWSSKPVLPFYIPGPPFYYSSVRVIIIITIAAYTHYIICTYIGYYTMFETIISHVEFRIILSDIIVCSRYRSYC